MRLKLYIAAGLAFGLALCLFFPLIVDAAGHIGLRNVDQTLRTRYYSIIFSDRSATEVTENTNGVLTDSTSMRLHNGTTAVAAPTDTSPGMNPYPCKIDVDFVDPTADSTLECDCVVLTGRDQFGNFQSETIGACTNNALNEGADPYESSKVYEKLNSATASGCSGGTAVEDVLRVACSGEVGLPIPVESENAIVNFCVYDLSATDRLCFGASSITTDLIQESVETDGLIGGGSTALADGDVLQMELRYPAGL